jgi:asparagine synthase (glutamine-hydrolysing)
MCGISIIIGDSNKSIFEMSKAIKHRGARTITQRKDNWSCAFEWLQLTGEPLDNLPNESHNHIVFLNGFITNHEELSEKYGITNNSGSDIEFLCKFFDLFSFNKLNELNGFFAIAAYQKDIMSWRLFTDRYGCKQLYTYNNHGYLYICSEVKGITTIFPDLELNKSAVRLWKSTLGVIPTNDNQTLWNGIQRVPKLEFVIPEKISISYNDAVSKLKELFFKSIERNIKSIPINKPVCVYLSGGVDSGMINKRLLEKGVEVVAVSIDYEDEKYSELDRILINGKHNKLHWILKSTEETKKHYSKMAKKFLCDPRVGSCYTNFQAAEIALKYCTVAFSGAGGDEFFGGYPHRLDKPIHKVINRTKYGRRKNWKISHFEYDLLFLSGVLAVEDRVSSAFTMETRYPLLDNDFVDFALSLPDEYLQNKRILKDISGLSKEILEGPKKGFSNPGTNEDWVNFILE